MIQQHRWTRIGDFRTERLHISHRVLELEMHTAGAGDSVGLLGTTAGYPPSLRLSHHFSNPPAEYRAGAAESDVANELLPNKLIHVVVRAHLETGTAPYFGDSLGARCARSIELAEPDQLPAIVMRVTGRLDRGAEATNHTYHQLFAAQDPGNFLRAPKPVLNSQDDCIVAEQRLHVLRRRCYVHRLGGDDHEIGHAHLVRVGRGLKLDDPISACAFDTQTVSTNRLDMLAPRVDRPNLITRITEQPGIHRAHRTGAHDRNLHRLFRYQFRFEEIDPMLAGSDVQVEGTALARSASSYRGVADFSL